MKGFKLKAVYNNKGEKAYDDLVWNNKKIDDVLYKKENNELSDKNKNIFQEAKKLFNLTVWNLQNVGRWKRKFKVWKKYWKRVKLKNQKDNLSETPKEFNDILEQIKEEQKTINMNLFKEYFNYESPDKMLKYLHGLETIDDYNLAASSIEKSFADFGDKVKNMPEGKKKTRKKNRVLLIILLILL